MQGTIQEYTLDMADGTAQKPLIVKQGDTNSRQARFKLTAFKEPWTIPFGAQIHINVHKNDGTHANATCTMGEDEYTVLAPITEQMTAVPGTQLGELFFLGSDGDIRSQTFPLLVWDAVSDLDLMASSNDFRALKDSLRQVVISTEAAAIATQYATEQGNAARDSAQRAENAADSLQVAVDAAAKAKASETNAKASETAAAQTQQEVTDYVESQKAAFVGYSKRETDSQYANAIIKTATGAGRVDVDDAWTAPVIGLDVAGRSEQVVTTGKNLFDFDKWRNISVAHGTAVWGDGKITLKSNAADCYTDYNSNLPFRIPVQPNTDYTLSWDTDEVAGIVHIFHGDLSSKVSAASTTKKLTITTNENDKSITFRVGVQEANKTKSYWNIMLNAGSAALPYEPYTAAAASPSPAYPQQIVSTGTVGTGAQLLDLRAGRSGTNKGITYTIKDGVVTASGTSSVQYTVIYLTDLTLSPGDYYISGRSGNMYTQVSFERDGETRNYSDSNFTILGTETNLRLTIQTGASTGPVSCTFRPMLNAGPYALPWEPYTGGKPAPSAEYPQPLNIYSAVGGRNLIPKANISPVGCNSVILDSTMEVRFGYTSVWSGTGIILGTFPAGTYTINYLDSTDAYRMISSVVIGDIIKTRNETYAQSNYVGGGGYLGKIKTPYSFELKSEAKIGLIVAKAESETDRSGTIKNLKLEKGELATPWVPAPEDITPENAEQYSDLIRTATITLTEPLRGTGEYRDRLGYRDGVWGIEGRYGVVDNTQWKLTNVYQDTSGHRFTQELGGILKEAHCEVICSKYLQKKVSSLSVAGDYVASSEIGRIHIRTLNPDFETLEAFKAHMADAETIYPLATPTWTPLPDSAQQALNALTTFTGTTHLTITTGGTTPDVTLDYVQDTHKALDQCREAAQQYTDNQLANIVAAMPVEVQAAIVDTQITTLLKEV